MIDATQPRARTLRVVLYAALWALGVAGIDTAFLPLEQFHAWPTLRFVLIVASHWFAGALLIVAFVAYAAPRWPPSAVVAATLLVVAPAAAVATLGAAHSLHATFPHIFGRAPITVALMGVSAPLAHYGWHTMFFGTLFAAGYVGADRSERTKRLLADAELARGKAEAQLEGARLQALQGHIDPAFLLRVMAAVQQRFDDDAAGADRLLDDLVAFLRAAMPAVRSGTSTLAGELALLHAHLALCARLGPGHTACRLTGSGSGCELAFPPLCLIPLVEQLSSASTPHAASLHIHVDDAMVVLRASGPDSPGWLAPALSYRLRVGLQAACAGGWTLAVDDAADPERAALRLTLAASPRGTTPTPGEEQWTTAATMTT